MRAVVFANGELNNKGAAGKLLLPDDLLIAADGGASHCRVLGVTPSILIGDLDSLTEVDLAYWEQAGTKVIRYKSRKDETDLELALLHAKANGVDEVLILGGLGRRWDQTFANLLLPAHEKLRGLQVTYWDDEQRLYLVDGERVIEGRAGQMVSLIPIGGDAEGVTTQGLEWRMDDETLNFGATRGVSNVMLENAVEVFVRKGLLLCVVSEIE